MHLLDVIIQPISTEKSEALRQNNVYMFQVHKNANKAMISKAIQSIYGYTPKKVNVTYRKSKRKRNQLGYGRTPLKKKAYVFFDKKVSVDVFEGV